MKKRCPRCKLVKDQSEFWRDVTQANGINTYCKLCATFYRNRRNERRRATGIEKRKRHMKAGRIRAVSRVQYLLKAGKLKRKPCFLCGEKKADGHHLSYEFPEKVIWLCRQHHSLAHLEGTIG